MKRPHFLILIWVLFFSTVQAQDLRSDDEGTSIEPATSANKKLYFGLGGNFSSFQDVKYSSVQFSGIGGAFELGFTKQKENRQWTLGMQSEAGIERATTNDVVSSYFGNVLFYYRYTKALKRKVSIGGRLDLMDTYFRKNNGLGNNGLYYLIGSHLYFSTNYHKTLSKKWRVEAILDLGLLSFYKESTGFGFSAPQNALEAGGFNYQDEALTNPFGFKYYHFQHLGKQ
ncbi:MAG TPA: hypothetical protein ENJ45_04100, partial [Phaeodactylibacter sp.]|nr:hypothetical protein [Phaeodactylibacter sp.]